MQFRGIILFGPPGSGKGTQSKVLASLGNFIHLSSGDVFRELDPSSRSAKLATSYASKGELVPDDITMQIIKSHIDKLIEQKQFFPKEQVLLLDGIPRTIQQAKILATFLDVKGIIVINIKDLNTLIQRIQKRAQLEGRGDDQSKKVLEKRLEVYKQSTVEILDYYPKALQRVVNGEQKPLKVLKDLLNLASDILIE